MSVSWSAIGKVLIALALVWAWLQLWQFVMVIAVAIVMAVALDPAVRKLEERGVPRGAGAFGLVLLLAGLIAGMFALSWVSISEQSGLIVENLRNFHQQLRAAIPAIDRLLPSGQGNEGLSQYAVTLARSSVHAFAMFVIALVLTVYLLIEWEATLEWVIAFVPAPHRQKLRRTLSESRVTVFRYVVGNVITSVITATATFCALAALNVPAALVLALIAGVFDLVPIIGFFLSLAVSALLAATVSLTTLAGVIAFYVVFNAVESYLINPRVYGHELKISKLAVLVAVAVGGQLAGVMGALLALPVAALYPTIERIWLKERLAGDTVDKHQRLSA
jgi:predicted PurR-regulated permease PerM